MSEKGGRFTALGKERGMSGRREEKGTGKEGRGE